MAASRRAFIAGLGAASVAMPLVAGDATGAEKRSAADRAFSRLAERWLHGSLRLSPINATQIGDHRFDALIDDVSAMGRARSLMFARSTLTALEAIERKSLSRANQVDAALLANALQSQVWTTEILQEWAWNPLNYQSLAGGAIYTLMARDFAPAPVRLRAVAARMEQIPTLLQQARAELVPARVPLPHALTYASQNKGLLSLIPEMIDPIKGSLKRNERERLDAAIAVFTAAINGHQAYIDATLIPAAKGDFRIGRDLFDAKLAYTLQTDLTRVDIKDRATMMIRIVRELMYLAAKEALAGRADAPEAPPNPNPEQQQRAISAALELAASDRPARHELVEASTAATETARQFLLAKDLITLPDGPVRVILMPEFQRGFAVAYCDSPGPLEKHLDTFYAVSPIPDDWTEGQATSFLREYNRRAIQDIAVHEAMPGHYVQIFHANSYPSVLRAVLSSGSFVEGWAVYAEQMMVEEGFLRHDPLYKLTQLKVLLRTITNAVIDQAIHVDGMTEVEMMRLLTETAFQEEREAAGKWRRAQLSSTQLSTYFVGYAEHMSARTEAQLRQRTAFNLKSYHDGILAFGSPPMRYARALYLGDPLV